MLLVTLLLFITGAQAQSISPPPTPSAHKAKDQLVDLSDAPPVKIAPVKNQKIVEISEGRYWKLLLHYRDSYPDIDRSEADGKDFFFSPKGRTDPYEELIATLEAFRSPLEVTLGAKTAHPQCFFPERFRYLREALGSLPEWQGIYAQKCPEYEEWKRQLKAKSVTLVYAAPYLGSPASLFGHTFLRIDSQENPMLDRGISFEAFTGSDGGMGYAIRGLIGAYPGLFTLVPYYLKTHMYSDAESRDLWEYELNLSPEQIERMLGHAWEMGTTYFDYYFIDQNCAYHLLSLLEVAQPDWHLREKFKIMTIPADTLRVLADIPGAVRQIHYRPSLLKILNTRLTKLSPSDLRAFYDLRNNLSRLTGSESAPLLDALLDWRKYESAANSETLNDPNQAIDSRLLSQRAKAPSGADGFAMPTAESEHLVPPHLGHLTSKVTVGGGMENHNSFYGLEFRPVLHDLLDPDAGYLQNTELTIADTKMEYQTGPNHAIRFEDFTLGEVETLTPYSRLKPGFAWDLGADMLRPKDINCVDCIAGQIRGGAGIADPLGHKALVYALVHAQGQGSGVFKNGFFRFGPSGELGTLISFTNNTKFTMAGEYFYYVKDNHFDAFHGDFSQSYKRFDFRLHAEEDLMKNANRHRLWATVGFYF